MITITKEMLACGQPIAQGEVLIWAKEYAPKAVLKGMAGLKNMQPLKLENDMLILGHSETGHHHVLEPVRESARIYDVATALIDAANDMFVELRLQEPCKLVHLRSNDTHKGIILPPGEYIRGLREEQFVEGWRRVAD